MEKAETKAELLDRLKHEIDGDVKFTDAMFWEAHRRGIKMGEFITDCVKKELARTKKSKR